MNRFKNVIRFLHFHQRNWKAILLCVLAATVFWFLNALNKTYTTNISFPLNFTYDQSSFVPVKSLPREVRINVTGNGWTLFRRSTGVKMAALEIPLDRPADTKKIISSKLPAFFSNQIDDLKINFVLSDTLYVDLEPKTGRWIKIALDSLQPHIKKGYVLASNISIMPDSIYIEGPRRVISDYQEPVRIKLPYRNIDDHFMEDVEIRFPSSEVVKRDPPTVAVMFNVEKMINVKDSIPLVMINIPAMAWPVMGRKYIPVVIGVPQNLRDQFTLDSARALLDLKNLPRGERMIYPRVAGLPAFCKVIKVDSVRVKF